MSEHTPGPWLVDCLEILAEGSREQGGWAVAEARFFFDYHEESAANARLIAAAPELLAALKGFVESWGDAIDNDDDINGGDAVEFIGGFLQDCRAAIAKAEGAP